MMENARFFVRIKPMEIAQIARIVFAVLAAILLVIIVWNVYRQRRLEKTDLSVDPLYSHNKAKKHSNETHSLSTLDASMETGLDSSPPKDTAYNQPFTTYEFTQDSPPLRSRSDYELDEISDSILGQISSESDNTSLLDKKTLPPPMPVPPPPPSSNAHFPYAASELITLRLQAPKGEAFLGDEIFKLMHRYGLNAGKHKIFHLYNKTANDPIVSCRFSVCSGKKPGTLELSKLKSLRTPLLLFFFNKNETNRPLYSFDIMVETAQSFLDYLGGTLLSQDKKPLSHQRVLAIRNQIKRSYEKNLLQHPIR